MSVAHEMTDSDQKFLADMEAKFAIDRKTEAAREQAVMDQVRAKVSAKIYADVKACVDDSGPAFDFKIVAKPLGHAQDDGYSFGPYFVDQTMNGGFTGDEFAGSISIPIGPGEFLQFAYSM